MITNVYASTRSPKIDTLYKLNSLEKRIKYLKETENEVILDFCGIKKVTIKDDLKEVVSGCKCINVKKGLF